jgi:hypothetical protein
LGRERSDDGEPRAALLVVEHDREALRRGVGTTADGSDLVADYEGPAFITGLPMARFLELYGEYQPNAGDRSGWKC